MHSCIYEGRVSHCRFKPVVHKFQYRLYMAYLDLDELEDNAQLRRLVRRSRFAAAGFLETDHVQGWGGPLSKAVRDVVARETGQRPAGPVRLLTQLRHFGYYFSPLNLFYCFDKTGTRVEAIVSEVNNTPWREQHLYVLAAHNQVGGKKSLSFQHAKEFHVSPFMEMEYRYHWKLNTPGDTLKVYLANRKGTQRTFEAAMSLSRRPLTRWQLTKMLTRYPVMTARIVAAIYWQALRLWWKKCPVYSHPEKQQTLRDAKV